MRQRFEWQLSAAAIKATRSIYKQRTPDSLNQVFFYDFQLDYTLLLTGLYFSSAMTSKGISTI